MTAAVIERRQAATDARTVESFMKGKCLAAMLALESMKANADSDANLCASFRDAGVQQDNYARKFLQQLLQRPDLLDGFAAGLSSIMGEAMEAVIGNAESVASISYDACTVHYDHDDLNPHDHYTAPALEDQIKAYGFDALRPGSPATLHDITSMIGHDVAMPSKEDENVLARMEDARIVFDALANDAGRAEPWGLLNLVEMAYEGVNKAVNEKDHAEANEASDVMAGAIALTAAVLDCDESGDMELLLPALSLIKLAKADLDEWIQSTKKATP